MNGVRNKYYAISLFVSLARLTNDSDERPRAFYSRSVPLFSVRTCQLRVLVTDHELIRACAAKHTVAEGAWRGSLPAPLVLRSTSTCAGVSHR